MRVGFILGVILLLFSGCSVKEYKLFQDENKEHTSNIQELNISYTSNIVPNDTLKIDIYNMNQKLNSLVSVNGEKSSTSEYIVPENGKLFFPLLGEVEVQGLSVNELNNQLTSRYKKYLNNPYVKSKITNHRVYVLGEISTQGLIPIEGNRISILEVISKSGGLTDHALRDRVRVIFEENGKYKMRTLDLTKLATLNTHNLMVKHNSIVYIEPKSTKAVKVAIDDYLPFMQIISTVLGTFLTIDYLQR